MELAVSMLCRRVLTCRLTTASCHSLHQASSNEVRCRLAREAIACVYVLCSRACTPTYEYS